MQDSGASSSMASADSSRMTSGASQNAGANQGPSASFAAQSSAAAATSPAGHRDKLGPQRPGDVAVRRTIQVVVRRDRLSILPDRDESPKTGLTLTGGKEIPVEGDTQFVADEFVSALREHVRDWGIAGSGLYWQPVLNLNVGPDGDQRANEISSLLRNSGIDVQRAQSARRNDQSDAQSTR